MSVQPSWSVAEAYLLSTVMLRTDVKSKVSEPEVVKGRVGISESSARVVEQDSNETKDKRVASAAMLEHIKEIVLTVVRIAW